MYIIVYFFSLFMSFLIRNGCVVSIGDTFCYKMKIVFVYYMFLFCALNGLVIFLCAGKGFILGSVDSYGHLIVSELDADGIGELPVMFLNFKNSKKKKICNVLLCALNAKTEYPVKS